MGGFLSSLVDSFTGKGARKDLDMGIGAVNANTGNAVGAYKQYGDQAQGYLKPYVDQGGKAFGLYGDTLGVNGAGARGTAEDLYNSDDMLAKQRAYDLSRSGRQANASGGFNSGTAALADSRIRTQNYGDWQNRLAGAGQQGQAASGTAAGLAENTGAGVAGAYGQSTGALTNLYGQRAQTENTLAQNMIGLGALGVSAFTGVPVGRYGVNNLGTQQGTQANGGWQTATTAQPQSWYSRIFG